MSACTCSLTVSSPTSESSSACSSASGRGGALRRGRVAEQSSSSGPRVRPAGRRAGAPRRGGSRSDSEASLPRTRNSISGASAGARPPAPRAGDALLSGPCAQRTLCDCHAFDVRRPRRPRSGVPPRSWREWSWLWPGRRGSFSASSAAARPQRLLDVLATDTDRGARPAASAHRGSAPAEHQHGEERDLRRDAAERVVEQVAVLGDPAAGAAREPHPAAAREVVECRRISARRSRRPDRGSSPVAGEPERVQRKRVLVGVVAASRPGSRGRGLDGVGVHAATVAPGGVS